MVDEALRLEAIEGLKKISEMGQWINGKSCDFVAIDYITEFCEKHEEFMEIFIACKFDPAAFYGYLKSNGDIEKLKKVVEIVNRSKIAVDQP